MAENGTTKGSRIRFRDGTYIDVLNSFTTAAKYLRKAGEGDGDSVFFEKADGTGRIFVGSAEAQHVVLEEIK